MKTTDLYTSKDSCCGCGLCAVCCPQKAIHMKEDAEGFLYPVIDERKCVDCQLCKKICAYQKPMALCEPQACYGAVTTDKKVLKKSASGGIAAAISRHFVKTQGTVYGCCYLPENQNLTVCHRHADAESELAAFCGSKYVQSDIKDCLQHIKKNVAQGRKVLFVGTPCQVAAVRAMVGEKYAQKLYTIDIVCHGVPSQRMFHDYIDTLKKKYKGNPKDFKFRDKTHGWGLHAKYIYQDLKGKEKEAAIDTNLSSYYSYFLDSEIYRNSCYSCRFAGKARVGDITIGDYWCFEKEHPEQLTENGGQFDVAEGVSCLLVNTAQGEDLLTDCGQNIRLCSTQFQKIAKWNKQLSRPSREKNGLRTQICSVYEKKGYSGVEKLFRENLGIRYYVRIVKNNIKKRRA